MFTTPALNVIGVEGLLIRVKFTESEKLKEFFAFVKTRIFDQPRNSNRRLVTILGTLTQWRRKLLESGGPGRGRRPRAGGEVLGEVAAIPPP